MLQNPCKTLGFNKIWFTKFPWGGGVNHIQPVAYGPIGCDEMGDYFATEADTIIDIVRLT